MNEARAAYAELRCTAVLIRVQALVHAGECLKCRVLKCEKHCFGALKVGITKISGPQAEWMASVLVSRDRRQSIGNKQLILQAHTSHKLSHHFVLTTDMHVVSPFIL